jgi:rhodanese-related sulfurtransferase
MSGDDGRIEELLQQERGLLRRVTPQEARDAVARGGVIIDTRSHEQRVAGGTVPGSVRIHRNLLEWRVDPTCSYRDPEVSSATGPIVVMCQEGYSSSLAAATLQRLGVTNATDMIGGFEAWVEAGLPTEPVTGPDDTPS